MTKRAAVVVLEEKDCRKPGSFIYNMGNEWQDFLKRWNDPNITTYEAKGLLHAVREGLTYGIGPQERGAEDSREARVRFLLHYANCEPIYDSDGQIVHEAREVLIKEVLNTTYIGEHAPTGLLLDVLDHLMRPRNVTGGYYTQKSYLRKIEAFLHRLADKKDSRIDGVAHKLILAIFRSKDERGTLRLGGSDDE